MQTCFACLLHFQFKGVLWIPVFCERQGVALPGNVFDVFSYSWGYAPIPS